MIPCPAHSEKNIQEVIKYGVDLMKRIEEENHSTGHFNNSNGRTKRMVNSLLLIEPNTSEK